MPADGTGRAPSAALSGSDDGRVLALKGDLVLSTVEELSGELDAARGGGTLTVDLSGVERLDTAGAWLLAGLASDVEAAGGTLTIEGANEAQEQLIETVRENIPRQPEGEAETSRIVRTLTRLGETTYDAGQTLVEITAFLGQTVSRMGRAVVRPGRVRFTSLVHHMEAVGVQAIPIVALMAFLIGIVLAYQGATQLQQFGAEVFVVELIAISILRELGILLTAIIVAGRTGSAFTASIGAMKMREEIDAMRTLGLDPVEVLVLPRVVALILVLPILGFIANIAGLFGGMLMSWIELGVSPSMFVNRLATEVDVWNYSIGLIKAPFFAIIIGIVGCYEGMKVEGNTESLGRRTSMSVVLAIFLVIVADAMFSIFFSILGV